MKIQKIRRKKSKLMVILTVVFALLIASVAAYYLYAKSNTTKQPDTSSNNKIDNTIDYKTPVDEQVQAGNDAKKDFIDQQGTDTVTPSSAKVNISITSNAQSGNTYQIRTMISTKNTDGSCTLTLTRADQTTVTQKAGVQMYPDYAVCKGFDIDTANIVKGDWAAMIKYVDSSSAGSVSKVISIQ